MIKNSLQFCFLILLCIGCSDNDSNSENEGNKSHQKQTLVNSDSDRGMQDSIKNILSKASFMYSIYENKTRVDMLGVKVNQKPNDINLRFSYARELLNNGDTRESILQIESIFKLAPTLNTINDQSKMFHEFLGICYLRVGEQKNCQENHNDASCIIPIADAGIHKFEEGSKKAIDIYSKILNTYPTDYQSMWLMNVAYMTLGKYPVDVPKKYFISLNKNKSELAISNISSHLGIDGFGLSGGVISDDFDNDGFVDIITSTWGTEGQMFFYKNDGLGSFKNATSTSGLATIQGGLNLLQTDFNNDGYLDIYVLRSGWMPERNWGIMPNSLLKNNGDGTFTDVTVEVGLYSVTPSQSASWFDFDNDGDLDLFVANETNSKREQFACELFENVNFQFSNVAAKYGLDRVGYFKGVTTADMNNDGLTDIYLSNLKGDNLYFEAFKTGDKSISFKEKAKNAGITYPMASFPCWTFDVNNDGYEDIYVASYDGTAFKDQSGQLASDLLNKKVVSESNYLYLNKGDGTFRTATDDYFNEKSLASMGCNYGDINNDGFPDFYLGTGAPDYRAIVPNRLFVNQNGKAFSDQTFDLGMGHIQKGHGISFADFDNDGDQDVYAVMGGAFKGDKFPNALFLNGSSENMNWLKLKLVGVVSNHAAIGAKIRVKAVDANGDSQTFYTRVSSGSSFGANTLIAEMGLGKYKQIESVEINWPNGKNTWTLIDGIESNKKYRIIEGKLAEEAGLRSLTFNLNSAGHDNKHAHHH